MEEVFRGTGTGITMDEARDSVSKDKILILETDKNKFDWDSTAHSQGNSISK